MGSERKGKGKGKIEVKKRGEEGTVEVQLGEERETERGEPAGKRKEKRGHEFHEDRKGNESKGEGKGEEGGVEFATACSAER